MSRHGPDQERIATARLSGTATRHAQNRTTDQQAAVDELRAIATEHIRGYGPRLRTDLLAEAAGALLGSHRYRPTTYWFAEAAAQLLITAGADPELTEETAATTLAKLRMSARPGIGGAV